jgi:predicted patatin/cPLA2 family phospholipase
MHPIIYRFALVVSLLFLAACAGITRVPAPADIYDRVTVLGRDDLRFWGDGDMPPAWSAIRLADPSQLPGRYPAIYARPHSYLAISGGGANGAYGAGVLTGWSELGTRPEFTMVTGISTGALTAPFAFLGENYDETLKEVYTTLDTTSILQLRNFFSIISADSVADTSPLKRTIEKYLTDDVIAEIAAEYRRGRALFIGTTNLDAGRPMIWHIGRIADSGHPDAPDLIRKILLASASIPGVFPPVYIPVQGPDGKTYDEMHVDGGTASQMFLYPSGLDWQEVMKVLKVPGQSSAFLIRNAYVIPDYEQVNPRLIPILGRSMDSLIRTQGIGDAYRIYALAERDGLDVQLTWIPNGVVEVVPDEAFDPDYMKALFHFGYQRMLDGQVFIDVADAIEQDQRPARITP